MPIKKASVAPMTNIILKKEKKSSGKIILCKISGKA